MKCYAIKFRFIFATAVLVLLTAFFISGTVESRDRSRLCIEERYYDEMEKVYVSEIKDCLKKYGIKNSGVNMTHISDAGQERSYRVIIHNRQLRWMDENKRERLEEEIKGIRFPSDSCSFYHEFVADKGAEKEL